MKKTIIFVWLTGVSLSLIACQPKQPTLYHYTPYVSGQIMNKETNAPLEGVKVSYTSKVLTYSDKNGNFYLPAISSPKKLEHQEGRIISKAPIRIYLEGYQNISYPGTMPRVPHINSYQLPNYIHMGKIYLTPLSRKNTFESMIDEYKDIESVRYCKSGESQKEVNCIPVPDGLTYEKAVELDNNNE